MLLDFYRSDFTSIAITLTSNEVLGILDTSYLEDYYGTDGQITLKHKATQTRYSVLMTEVSGHKVFTGFFELTGKPSGEYEMEGQVRDVVGNHTVLNRAQTPMGGARTIAMIVNILDGEGNGSGESIVRLEGVDKCPLLLSGGAGKPLLELKKIDVDALSIRTQQCCKAR